MSCSRSRSGSGPSEPLAAIATRVSKLCHSIETLVTNIRHHEHCIIKQLQRFDDWASTIRAYDSEQHRLEDRLREYSRWLPHDTLQMLQELEINLCGLSQYLLRVQERSDPVDHRESLGGLVSKTKNAIARNIEDLYRVQHAIEPPEDEGEMLQIPPYRC